MAGEMAPRAHTRKANKKTQTLEPRTGSGVIRVLRVSGCGTLNPKP